MLVRECAASLMDNVCMYIVCMYVCIAKLYTVQGSGFRVFAWHIVKPNFQSKLEIGLTLFSLVKTRITGNPTNMKPVSGYTYI
jgi:hypothetical protein